MVGFTERPATGYTIFNPSFQKVGGGDTVIDDLIDTATLTPYTDEIQVYDPEEGLFYQYIWMGDVWSDWIDSKDIVVKPGSLYVANFMSDTKVFGEVVNGETLKYAHDVPAGYSLFGSAFPVALKQSNFNFADVMTMYTDEVQTYNPEDGCFYQFIWDGTGFTDYIDYLPDEIAPIGEGVVIGNNSGFTGLVEDINPKAE